MGTTLARTKLFRVVAIDDKADNLRRLESLLRGIGLEIGGTRVRVDFKTVHVKLERRDGSAWTISDDVFEELRAASRSPIDLMLVDYIYVDEEEAPAIKSTMQLRPIAKHEVADVIFTPQSLRQWVERRVGTGHTDARRVLRSMFDQARSVYLHTYTPTNFEQVAGSIEERRREASVVFPNAALEVIDTRRLLFNDNELDTTEGKNYRSVEYQAYQLGTYFSEVIQKEVLRREYERSRFFRWQRTSTAVAAICAIGASIGFGAEWVGSFLFGFIQQGAYASAALLGALLLLMMFGLGLAVTKGFDWLMSSLVRQLDEEDQA